MNVQQIVSIVSMIIGWISLGCVCAYAIPQFIKIIRTKNTSSMAVSTYVMFCICSALMLVWNIGNVFKLNEDTSTRMTTLMCVLTLLPAVVLNLLNVTINISSLIIKIRHLRMCKKLKIDELELSHILLKKKQNKKGRK